MAFSSLRFTAGLALAITISSCVSKTPASSPLNQRAISSLRCVDIFNLETPREEFSRAEFHKFMNHFEDIDLFGSYIEGLYVKPRNAQGTELVYLGKELRARHRAGESTPRILKDLGYVEDGAYFRPPRSPRKLYLTIFETIAAKAKAAGLKPDEIIYPALLLRKNERLPNEETMYVRPGIDPWPQDRGWHIAFDDAFVPVGGFSKLIAAGMMPLATELFSHEISHIVDMIENPQYMKVYRHFSRERLRLLAEKKIVWNSKDEILYDSLSRIFNEFLYFVNPAARMRIQEFYRKASTEREQRLQVQSRYHKMTDTQLQVESARVASLRYYVIKRAGGGARDNTYENTIMDSYFNTLIVHTLMPHHELFRPQDTLFFMHLSNDLPALFHRIKYFSRLLSSPSLPLPFETLHKEVGFTVADIREAIRISLEKSLAELEYRLLTGLDVTITQEQIAKDVTALMVSGDKTKYAFSATSNYFKQTYQAGTPNHQLWVFLEPTVRLEEGSIESP